MVTGFEAPAKQEGIGKRMARRPHCREAWSMNGVRRSIMIIDNEADRLPLAGKG